MRQGQNGYRMLVIALCVPLAWLLGTFPSAQLVARAHGRDILKEGSGNPGASNVARLLGWRAGAIVLLCDFAKGLIAAGAGMALGGRPGAFALGVAAIVGHTFPLYRKGGKGIATGGGALVVLYPWIVLGLAVVWFVVARLLHKASLASLLIAVLFPVAVIALRGRFDYHTWEIVVIVALAVLVITRHIGNIRRLLRRQENDLGAR
jgi:acyl phosphate:glycerol-3-phosphate acyltransferase